jgi:hypothetical protein
MKNRLTVIVVLVSFITGFFVYRYYLQEEKPFPKIEDRLPDAEILGKINITEFSDELKPLLFKNKIKYRDFIASDFILSQTKNLGINLQKPVYFYITEQDDFGALISVNDSSKVPKAIMRIKSFFDVQDTIVNGSIIYKISDYNTYLCFERNWLFIYKGNQFIKNYFQVKYADHTSMKQCWKNFLNDERFMNENLSLYIRPKKLLKERLDYFATSINVDSNNVHLKTVIADNQYFPIQLKKGGLNFVSDLSTAKHFVNLHVNIDSLKTVKKHFIYSFIKPYTNKVNFPLEDFIQGWNGDLSINVNGKKKVAESFVETEFDDDFNSIEVTKTRFVERDMFSFVMSTTPSYRVFLDRLFAKGFLRKNNNDYFFLMFSSVKLITKSDVFYVYTGRVPKTDSIDVHSEGRILYDNTNFEFKIDSTSQKEMYLNLTIPFNYIQRKSKYAL